MDEYELYLTGKSIPEVSKITGVALSTLRFRLKKAGIIRTRADAIRLSSKQGKLGAGNRGKKRVFTEEWKANISKSKKGIGVGLSLKPNGYLEITMGPNKGRGEHVVLMEKSIGRRLYSNECVHHKNENRADNRIENLKLMTRAEHSRLHAKLRVKTVKRDKEGKFK